MSKALHCICNYASKGTGLLEKTIRQWCWVKIMAMIIYDRPSQLLFESKKCKFAIKSYFQIEGCTLFSRKQYFHDEKCNKAWIIELFLQRNKSQWKLSLYNDCLNKSTTSCLLKYFLMHSVHFNLLLYSVCFLIKKFMGFYTFRFSF